jgi:hypothetical protein
MEESVNTFAGTLGRDSEAISNAFEMKDKRGVFAGVAV